MAPASTKLTPKYDVFISYSSRDRAMAEDLAKRLREAGLSLFFDRWRRSQHRLFTAVME